MAKGGNIIRFGKTSGGESRLLKIIIQLYFRSLCFIIKPLLGSFKRKEIDLVLLYHGFAFSKGLI